MQIEKSLLQTGRSRRIALGGSLMLFLGFLTNVALAQTVTTVWTFNGTNGANPFLESLTQGRDGKLYGTTYNGGASNQGTVFRFNPATNSANVLHSFDGTNGANPGSGLTLATDGNYYGATVYGGSANLGVLYKIAPSGAFTVLHQFLGGSDGSYPYFPPIEASDGNLYGVAGGGNFEAPTVYQFTRSGAYNIVYTFDRSTSGWAVYGLIQGSDNLLYTTANAGGAKNCGAVAKFTLTGVLKATHAFNCSNQGAYPVAPLLQASDGNYYGTTQGGGTNGGVLYQITSAFGENVLYNIGNQTNAPVIQGSDGNLYGVTYNPALLYSWNLTSGFTDVYNFTGTSLFVAGLLQDTSGLFYGLSQIYGTNSDGYIYSVDLGLGPFVAFVHAQGKVGSTAQILGQGLTGATGVTFNGIATSFSRVSDTYLTAVVPVGATTGPVVVTTSSGTLTSNKNFRVSP